MGSINHVDEEEREGQSFSFSGNGHLASFEDLDSEGLDFMTGAFLVQH